MLNEGLSALVDEQPGQSLKLFLFLVIGTCLNVFAGSHQVAFAQGRPTPVRVGSLKLEELRERIKVPGSIRAAKMGQISALESGKIEKINVSEGEEVKAGDVLAEIDRRRLERMKRQMLAQQSAARAVLERRNAELKDAEEELESRKLAASKNALSRNSLRRGKTDVAVSKANVAEAKSDIERIAADLELLEVRLADTYVRAPYDAWVTKKHIEVGEWANSGSGIVSLIAKNELEAWLEVPQRQLAGMTTSPAVTLTLAGKSLNIESKHLSVIREINMRTRTFYIKAKIPADYLEKHVVLPGLAIYGWLETGKKQAVITVPRTALIRRNGLSYVYKIDAKSMAVQIPVSVKFNVGDRIAIDVDDRLKHLDKVVIEGNERLMPHSPVQLLN